MRFLFLFLVSLIFPEIACADARPQDPPPVALPPEDRMAHGLGQGADIASKLNYLRYRAEVRVLDVDDTLTCAAVLHAAFLAHMKNVCVEAGQMGLATRLQACGATLSSKQVVACGYKNIEAALGALDASAPHRKYLYDPDLKRIGATMIDNQWVIVMGY